MNQFRIIWTIVWIVVLCQPKVLAYEDKPRTLVVIFDGLRKEYITETMMPNLYKFRQGASYANNNHNVFPTVTRVNSPSYSTGAYPDKHGLMGNALHVPGIGPGRVFETGDARQLMELDSLTNGQLITTPSLAEILSTLGEEMYVFSSGSTGQAFLQNPRVKGKIINPTLILPEGARDDVITKIGDPARLKDESHAHSWVTDAFLEFGLPSNGPLVSSIWYSQPDGAEHRTGIASRETLEALKSVDGQFGRIMDALRSRNLLGKFNIFVTTDHGFITYKGRQSIVDFLVETGYKKGKLSTDVIVADGAIFVENHDRNKIEAIVRHLQAQPWIGPIFTKSLYAGSSSGHIPGTLSFETFHWNHPTRVADILVTYNWYDDEGVLGFKGVADNPGVAGHGGISLYEVSTPLLIAGPSFKKAFVNELPTAVIDIAPTILDVYGIEVPATMDGRILYEFYVKGMAAPSPKVEKRIISERTTSDWGSYEVQVQQSIFNGHTYFDFGKVVRKMK